MTQNKSSAQQTTGVSAPAASSQATKTKPARIPKSHDGIQYNACKNPACAQYGLSPPDHATKGVVGPYAITYGGKGYPLLKCNACGEMPPMKSNKGITEEVERLAAYLQTKELCCPNDKPHKTTGELCSNNIESVPVGTPKAYRAYGTNAHGSKRMQCCACGKTFIVASKPDKGQHETHQNRDIFKMLVNKVALARIVRMSEISWDTLYRRIDFIHSQCMAFAARRERKLQTHQIKRLYLSIDAQDYLVNWTERKDKRNIVLKAITAADNKTGYVFVNALNFDERADGNAIEQDSKAINDAALPAAHRKYARIWTRNDYAASVAKSAKKPLPAGSLAGDISNGYHMASLRDDIEEFDGKAEHEALPSKGVQIHSEYTMIAMFHHLRNMIGNCDRWRFFLDQESGIRAACLGVFKEEISSRDAEAFYVRIEKSLTNDQKQHCVNDAQAYFDSVKQSNPALDDDEIRLLLIKEEIANLKHIGAFNDKWVSMPLPSMSEPNKAVCWLTEHKEFDEDHIANLYGKASLHGVDSFFQKVRRSIYMCERPPHSSANAGRIWGAYQAYDPAVLKKLLEIYRVHHNYIDLPMKGKKSEKKTPAMRLGLAEAPLDFKDIIYFK